MRERFLLSGNIGGNVVPTPTSAMICGGTGKGITRMAFKGTVCALAGVCYVSAGVSLPWNGYAPGDLEFWKRGRAFLRCHCPDDPAEVPVDALYLLNGRESILPGLYDDAQFVV